MKFFPKNKKIYNLCERLEKSPIAEIDSTVAKEFSRYKEMRFLREKDLLFIGKDHRKNMSIIHIKIPVKKIGNGFIF